MSRPYSFLSSDLTSEQIEEMIKLSATKTVGELSEIYKRDRATIYYHLKRAGKTSLPAVGNKKRKLKPRPPKYKFKREEKINSGKNYIDYLKIENESRKKQGLYLLKQK